jgi:hypothetical protein
MQATTKCPLDVHLAPDMDKTGHENSNDFVLTLPSKPDGAWCPDCLKIKSLRHFKRLASMAQTRAWLRNPLATLPLEYEGKECNDCHKAKSKRPEDLTREQMRKRLHAEGVHALVVEGLIKKRKAKAAATHKEVIRKNRQKLFAEDYANAKRELDKLSKRVERAKGVPELSITTWQEEIRQARFALKLLKQQGKKPTKEFWDKLSQTVVGAAHLR